MAVYALLHSKTTIFVYILKATLNENCLKSIEKIGSQMKNTAGSACRLFRQKSENHLTIDFII